MCVPCLCFAMTAYRLSVRLSGMLRVSCAVVTPEITRQMIAKAGLRVILDADTVPDGTKADNVYLNRDYLVVVAKA